MTDQRRSSLTSVNQIQPTPGYILSNESKSAMNHFEDVENRDVDEKLGPVHEVQDSDAKDYVNPDLIIDEKENLRLRRMINWR